MWGSAKTASTTERGYGNDHQKTRAAAIARFQQGDACARCGGPMYGDPKDLDMDHTEDRRGYRGLAHRHCNRTAGARKGNRTRRARTAARSRNW